MRAAPAVQVVAADGGGWRAVRRTLYALAAMVAAAWCARWLGGTAGLAAVAAAAAGSAAAGLHASRAAAPPRRLRWDGARWAVDAADGGFAAGSVRPALDLGSWLLLRFDPAAGGAAQWLPVGRAQQPAAWPALRAAVFAGPAAEGGGPAAP